jgi:hypothetical protein
MWMCVVRSPVIPIHASIIHWPGPPVAQDYYFKFDGVTYMSQIPGSSSEIFFFQSMHAKQKVQDSMGQINYCTYST